MGEEAVAVRSVVMAAALADEGRQRLRTRQEAVSKRKEAEGMDVGAGTRRRRMKAETRRRGGGAGGLGGEGGGREQGQGGDGAVADEGIFFAGEEEEGTGEREDGRQRLRWQQSATEEGAGADGEKGGRDPSRRGPVGWWERKKAEDEIRKKPAAWVSWTRRRTATASMAFGDEETWEDNRWCRRQQRRRGRGRRGCWRPSWQGRGRSTVDSGKVPVGWSEDNERAEDGELRGRERRRKREAMDSSRTFG